MTTQELNQVVQKISSKHYVETIYAPRQTHAVYAIQKENLYKVRKALKEIGATNLRNVTTRYGLKIVCFKMG